ncbi:MAG: hypothetical protein ACXWHD_04145, partial [Candidatus Aminicenantales bacterium]
MKPCFEKVREGFDIVHGEVGIGLEEAGEVLLQKGLVRDEPIIMEIGAGTQGDRLGRLIED